MVAASLAMRWSLSDIWNNAGFLEIASALSTIILILGAVIEEWPKLKQIGLLAAKLIVFRSTAFERCVLKKLVAHSIGAILVVVGIAGELVFETRTFIVEDRETATLSKEAGDAKQSATDAATQLQLANERLAAFEKTADGLDKRLDAAGRNLDAVSKKTEQLHEFLTPRSLTQKDMDDLRDSLKPLADPSVRIVVTGSSWEPGLAIQVWNSLISAGFEKAELRLIQEPVPEGMGASSPLKYTHLTGEIAGRLMKAGISPMVGVLGITIDIEPIQIFVGDIRTAPLPSLKQPSRKHDGSKTSAKH